MSDKTETAVRTVSGESASPRPVWRDVGDRIGRFIVTDFLGAGGGGEVYAVYDPVLERKIAVKLLQDSKARTPSSRERFIAEARAAARLNHPNVVRVFDVGDWGGEVYIAMEWVVGRSLRAWLLEKREVGQVLEVFEQAGEGLASAHDSSIVHRDFKPSNVLVGDDGVVRVIDFGLARGVSEARDGEGKGAGVSLEAAGVEPNPLGASTRTGVVLGTPAYMAPEQAKGGRVGPEADQYAFAVALTEALAGTRPSSSKDVERVLGASVLSGSSTASRLVPILSRALQENPRERYRSMRDLTSALHRVRLRKRRYLLAAALAAMALVSLALAAYAGVPRGDEPCGAVSSETAEFWNEGVVDRLRRRFDEARNGPDFEQVESSVADWVAQWRSIRESSCREALIENTQSQNLYDRQTICLRRRLGRAAMLLRYVESESESPDSDAEIGALLRLPALEFCADKVALTRLSPSLEGGAEGPDSEIVRRLVDEAWALDSLNRLNEAFKKAEDALAASEGISSPRYVTEALSLLSDLESNRGNFERAEELKYDAILSAASIGDDLQIARLWSGLVWTLYQAGRYQDAILLMPAARAAGIRAGELFDESHLLNNLGIILAAAGHFAEAETEFQRGIDLVVGRGPLVGNRAKRVGAMKNGVGLVRMYRGDLEGAIGVLTEARQLAAASDGVDSFGVVIKEINLAMAFIYSRDVERALPLASRARGMLVERFGPQHPYYHLGDHLLARAYLAGGDLDTATMWANRFRARLDALGDSEVSDSFVELWQTLALVDEAGGKLKSSESALDKELEMLDRMHSEREHLAYIEPLSLLARVLLLSGRREASRAAASDAVRLCDRFDIGPLYCAEPRLVLSRTVKDRAVATQLAGAAAEGFAALPWAEEERRRAEAWLERLATQP